MDTMGLSPEVVVSTCYDCSKECNYQFTMVEPSKRVVGCNRYQTTQIFETDGVISLASRFKFVDRPDIKETSSILQRVVNKKISLDHTLSVLGVLGCFAIGIIAFAEGSLPISILATVAGLGFIVYAKKLEEHIIPEDLDGFNKV